MVCACYSVYVHRLLLLINHVCCGLYAGKRPSALDMNPALEMFYELMNDTSQFKNQEATQWASIGHFIRSEVHLPLF